ncbi:hypothetical protein QTG54_000010, partial [Skeletonema marinoi]
PNQARARGVCIRHGAKVKRCSSEGCTNQARSGGMCIRHRAKDKAKKCSSEGCTNPAQNGGVCKRHEAKVKICINEGCTNQARDGGVDCVECAVQSSDCATAMDARTLSSKEEWSSEENL